MSIPNERAAIKVFVDGKFTNGDVNSAIFANRGITIDDLTSQMYIILIKRGLPLTHEEAFKKAHTVMTARPSAPITYA